MLGAEGPHIAQVEVVFHAGLAAVLHRQRIDRRFEAAQHPLGRHALAEVAQHHRVVDVDRAAGKQALPDESLDLGNHGVVAADQAQVFHQLPGEEGHHAAAITHAGVVQQHGVVFGAFQHGFEDDLSGFLRVEGLERRGGGSQAIASASSLSRC